MKGAGEGIHQNANESHEGNCHNKGNNHISLLAKNQPVGGIGGQARAEADNTVKRRCV